MVARHWVRGHFRGGNKTAVGVGAFLTLFILGGIGFWLYDSMRGWEYASMVWWGLAFLLMFLVVASIVGAAWYVYGQWQQESFDRKLKHRPRYYGARATSHVHVNVTVSPENSVTSATKKSPPRKNTQSTSSQEP